VSSLPSATGIGNFGEPAYRFVDFLHQCGLRTWQICPLGPTGYGDSPYQCFSAFAGNPYFIDLAPLVQAGLLTEADCAPLRELPTDHVDYGWLYSAFWPILELASKNFRSTGLDAIQDYGSLANFREEQSFWLEDYALFMGLKSQNKGACWLDWPEAHRNYSKAAKQKITPPLQAAIDAQIFYQYIFYGQLRNLRQYATAQSIEILGDVPIFVALDSADVWSHPELFQLDQQLKPTAVAGVPPDYFSADGQLWGNPLYAWQVHQQTGFNWWIRRMLSNLAFYDIVRIDHFRGFESFWSVPAGEKTARNGTWIKSPGLELFQAIKSACPEAKIVAEDLGIITPEVEALRKKTGLPGMAVLQFAFGGDDTNAYLPHNITKNTVVYTGTHDNDTTIGWYQAQNEALRDHVRRYLGVSGKDIAYDLVRGAIKTTANLAVVPLQDLMRLDSGARLNTPGSPNGNWQWRFQDGQLQELTRKSGHEIRELLAHYGR